jgi:hypothetical protein
MLPTRDKQVRNKLDNAYHLFQLHALPHHRTALVKLLRFGLIRRHFFSQTMAYEGGSSHEESQAHHDVSWTGLQLRESMIGVTRYTAFIRHALACSSQQVR